MPVISTETVRHQQDRDSRELSRRPDEPRNFVGPSHDPATPHGRYAGFDADLNPIDDDVVNTRGSER